MPEGSKYRNVVGDCMILYGLFVVAASKAVVVVFLAVAWLLRLPSLWLLLLLFCHCCFVGCCLAVVCVLVVAQLEARGGERKLARG